MAVSLVSIVTFSDFQRVAPLTSSLTKASTTEFERLPPKPFSCLLRTSACIVKLKPVNISRSSTAFVFSIRITLAIRALYLTIVKISPLQGSQQQFHPNTTVGLLGFRRPTGRRIYYKMS